MLLVCEVAVALSVPRMPLACIQDCLEQFGVSLAGSTPVSLEESLFVPLELIEELARDDTSLVVLGVELPPERSVVVMVGPVLQGKDQAEAWLTFCPVAHDVLPGVGFGCPCPICMQDRHVGDE